MCGLYYCPEACLASLLASGANYGIGNNGLGYTQVTHCRNGAWCCNNNEGLFLSKDCNEIIHSPLAKPTAFKWLTTTTALSASSGTSTAVSQAKNNPSGLSTSNEIKIGLRIPGVMAGAIAIGSGVYKWRRKHTKRKPASVAYIIN